MTAPDILARRAPLPVLIVLALPALCLLAILPVVLVRFLPVNDYPFHLARIFILAHLADPTIARFYSAGSFLLPNVGMDAIALPLSKLLGAENAVRFFVALTLVVTLVGAAALHYAAHRRVSAWPFLAFSFLHNGIFRFGFFNYLFGLGLALAAAAAWLSMPRGLLRLGIAFIACVVLIFCHMEAFGVFALTVAGCELYNAFTAWRRTQSWQPFLELIYSASPFLLTLVLFFLLSPTAKVAGHGIEYAAGLGTKPIGALFSLSSGIVWLDALTAFAITLFAVWLFFSRQLTYSGQLLTAAILLLLALIGLPTSIMGATYVDSRLGPAVALLLLLSLGVRADAPRLVRRSVLGLAFALAVLRTGTLVASWVDYNEQITPIVRAFDRIEPGSTLFAVTSEPYPRLIADTAEKRAAWRPPLKHVASYAVLRAPVFVPMTWSDPTQQPLIVKAPFEQVKEFQGNNPDLLTDPAGLASYTSRLESHLADGHWPILSPVYILAVGRDLSTVPRALSDFRVVARGPKFVLLRWYETNPHRGGRAF